MISNNIDNLRKDYVFNLKKQKDQNYSNSKVYTFNESDLNERNLQTQLNLQKKTFNCEQSFSLKASHSDSKKIQHKRKLQKNKQNLQSSPSQLKRYLKEYQYNCYNVDQNNPLSILDDQRKCTLNGFSSDKKLGIKYKQEPKSSKQIKGFCQKDQPVKNLLNLSMSKQQQQIKQQLERKFPNLALVNAGRNLSQQIKNRIHPRLSNTLKFDDLDFELKFQSLCSQEQICLIKLLRLQISELKAQIQKNNIYIIKLQQKLEKHLIQRIQVQKILEENSTLLENKIHSLELQIQKAHQKLTESQNQMLQWKNIGSKIHVLFSSFGQTSSKSVFQFSNKQIQQSIIRLLEEASQLDTYKKLIQKVQQMKTKIEKLPILSSSQKQLSETSKNKELCLRDLWKWLKKVGKEYEIMKHRVTAMQNISSPDRTAF